VVALSAMLLAVESGAQAVLMAPTEILAEQHMLGLSRLLEGLPVRWALVTGGQKSLQKRRDREALARGEISIAVGTHALLQERVAFHRLGVTVIDEQHRFGVAQRAALAAKGTSPHVLLMTATPIPRTLAMTLYGDLAVSVLDQRPPGRPEIQTRSSSEPVAWASVRRAVAAGRQAYVVFPLVDVSEKLDLRAVLEGWKRLSTAVFPDLRVGLLHGRMKSAEKEAVMAKFSAGEIQILCATPVIEVGVDVPNATVMVVLNAERFGLAALHQLRGRVGRGRFSSECHLVSTVGEASARLRLLCQLSDGFRLAEEDLRLRGPGEFLGEAQHGLPTFKAGDLVRDGAMIEEARREAEEILRSDPGLSFPEHRVLSTCLLQRFGERLGFGRVA
jgi:ATP-dependent DNA helicase RecG